MFWSTVTIVPSIVWCPYFWDRDERVPHLLRVDFPWREPVLGLSITTNIPQSWLGRAFEHIAWSSVHLVMVQCTTGSSSVHLVMVQHTAGVGLSAALWKLYGHCCYFCKKNSLFIWLCSWPLAGQPAANWWCCASATSHRPHIRCQFYVTGFMPPLAEGWLLMHWAYGSVQRQKHRFDVDNGIFICWTWVWPMKTLRFWL